MLIRTGHYGGKVTGTFDRATETAVRNFQQSAGLAVDGRPGGKTLLTLYKQTGGAFSIHSTHAAPAEDKR
jgi:peptidoglycan hydrolase-like protein with peptidoglycan-binding domain